MAFCKLSSEKINTFPVFKNANVETMGQQYAVPSASVSEWKSAGWNEEQIKRAVNEGRINIK